MKHVIKLTDAQLQLLKNLLADEAEATRDNLADLDPDDRELNEGWLNMLQETAEALAGDKA